MLGPPQSLLGTSIVIWTTTPWTIPGNRAIAYSPKINYELVEVTEAPDGNWLKVGDRVVLASNLVDQVMAQAKVAAWNKRRATVTCRGSRCRRPARIRCATRATTFDVPMLAADYVTDEDGTGFVHTAPGHGREDFDTWTEYAPKLQQRGIDTTIPFTVDGDGRFTKEAPGFEGKRVIDDKGNKGDANDAVIKALAEAGMMVARARLKHQYPHSWRSKKPVIFRNTPQWFIAMDKPRLTELPSSARPSPQPSPRKYGEGAAIGHCAETRCRPSPRPSSCRRRDRTACAA